MPNQTWFLLAADSGVKASFTGEWSLYSLLLVGLCIFIGFVGLIALIVLAVMGRFRGHLPEDTPPAETGEAADSTNEQPLPAHTPQPRRKTGLWQMVAAVAVGVASPLCYALTDNVYGRMVAMTGGTILQLVLLLAQIVFILLVFWRQRGLPGK
ncbi:MAG: hypothetical protein GXY32_09240 [Ruminococcaceae bacterium]|nr:hypothetical protein [Oscillospiraceae bacterium]